MQRLLDFENTVPGEENFRRKGTIYNGRKKVCVNYQTDLAKLKNVLHR